MSIIIPTKEIFNLGYAGDMILSAEPEEKLQVIVYWLDQANEKYNLTGPTTITYRQKMRSTYCYIGSLKFIGSAGLLLTHLPSFYFVSTKNYCFVMLNYAFVNRL